MDNKKDWEILSSLRPLALDRLCTRILKAAAETAQSSTPGRNHDTYLKLFRQIKQADQDVALCFDHWSRNDAFITLLAWRSRQIITDEEFQRFSPEFRTNIERTMLTLSSEE